ncbi:DNA internalization-related competence protein ComEC/Rec2 [Paenactinomyces guangxiensis]|uniref:DNA internalization-related competence protein ComEC/Rec2 n=1 Tax=Paenactinomyces guangxiensis TaxID=1490290 RepID=A0A7W2A719_9BACL|nr:DNA internalization-related competence protein ComEC/Rec2 [Paenactinomyces guangxiensis]MBA4493100.1 DNA internalization-related competence protein ComEC/Rec2 [Paenactinomyces guangxiensis]MBH8590050.1 DNA internalization-related competence protein ComEC/Rec2 [Paenactinomyces guangxiensis]
MKRPLVLLSLGWITGSLLCYGWWKSVGFYLCMAMGVAVVGGWLFYQYRKGLLITLFLLGWAIGAARMAYVDIHNHSVLKQIAGSREEWNAVLAGEICSRPQVDGDRLLFELKVQNLRSGSTVRSIPDEIIKVTVVLKSKEEWEKAHQFQRFWKVEMPLALKTPSPPRNPGAFDYRAYLYRQQIHWLGINQSFGQIKIVSDRPHLFVWMDELRNRLGVQIENIYSPEHAGLIRGMLLGERNEVDPDLEADYSALGIVHLLSISGLHVGVIVACLYFILKRAGLTREKAALFVMLSLPFYVLLTGAGAPVVRSAVMAGLAMLAVLLNRWKDTLSFLAFSLLIQLWVNPYQMVEAGFQLSYLVTAALIICVKPLAQKLPFPWIWLNQGVAVTLVAQVVSFPVLIRHFHEFSFISWLANLLFVPVTSSLVIPLSMLALGVSLVKESWGSLLAELASLLLDLIHTGVYLLLQLPWVHANWVPPSFVWILFYGMVSVYLWISWTGDLIDSARHRVIAGLCFTSLIVAAHQMPAWDREQATITFLDVGQGDCTVIETMKGKVILVDGGGIPAFPRESWQKRSDPFEVGKKVLVPYLKYRGIRRIDELVLTHGDLDHIGGLQAVAERFPVGRVIRNPHPPRSLVEGKLLQTLVKKGTPVYTVSPGSTREIEPGVKWQFLHPDRKNLGSKDRSNDDSVVFLLSVYHYRVMMTGDLEHTGEKKILSAWDLPEVHLLKVAHHGSRTSTQEEWLQALRPRQAVISAGTGNRYGHPSPEIIQRLQSYGVRIWRTDLHGAVTVQIGQDRTAIKTMLPHAD